MGVPGGAVVKNLPASSGHVDDAGSTLGSRRSPGGGNGNPLQFSCLGNSMDDPGGYRPWSLKESETTEHAHATHSSLSNLVFSELLKSFLN